jgi:hypothetical protein
MDTNSITVIVVLFALVAVVGFVVYRRKAKVKMEALGVKMEMGAENDPTVIPTNPSRRRGGIFGNWSIGKTRMKVKGTGEIADNRSMGDTDLKVDATPPATKPRGKRTR